MAKDSYEKKKKELAGKVFDPITKMNVARKPMKQQMGGTTSHNGKPDTEAMIKKSQAHHEANLAKRAKE